MKVTNKTILVTGANRGLGHALVEEALKRSVKRVYAAVRRPFAHADAHVTPLILDVTDTAQIRLAAEKLDALDMLINNAGVSLNVDFSDRSVFERLLAVNLLGPYDVISAVLPLLTRSRGAIVNILSLASLAPAPFSPAYSVSKAAAFSMSQAFRGLLSKQGVRVHAVLPGPMDTDMTQELDIPKASTESAARAIFDAVERGEEEIFPDPMSETMAEGWRSSAVKAFERQMAAYIDASPVTSSKRA